MIYKRVAAGLLVGLALLAFGAGYALAAEAPGHGGEPVNTNPLEFKKDLALWTGVVFLVLMAVLWKFAWGPIAQGLERREQGIGDQIDQADQANRQAKDLLAQHEQQLSAAKGEVRGMLDQARRDAEQVGSEVIEKAQQEARAEQQRAARQIDAATAAALKELAEQGANLAVELAGKIVRAELKADDHARLIEQAVGDFARHGPDRGPL